MNTQLRSTRSARTALAVVVAAAAIATPMALASVANAEGLASASSPAFIAGGFCAGKPDGDYPDPGLATAYNTCRGGRTFNLPCPWGETFYPPLINQIPDAGRAAVPCSMPYTGSA